VVADALNILGKSLRKSYLPDLLIRHAKAVKSQTERASGHSVGPMRGVAGAPYKSMPVKPV
jgi:hypothetical protein